MSEKIIEVKELVKHYKNITAVDKISFDVYRGEIFSLVGPNGAGKTTTVEILECLRNPTSGEAKVLGCDIASDDAQIKKRIGVMPQDFNAFDRLSVKENVEFIAKIYGVKNPSQKIEQIVMDFGMLDAKDKKFNTLSGGMKRRVGICMALINDPDILFLDEPTAGLDPRARKDTWDAIKNLKRMGKTVFLTTHYMEEVENLSNRAALIFSGKIIAIDTTKKLISKYGGDIKLVIKDTKNKEAEEVLTQFTGNIFRDGEGNIVGNFQSRKKAAKALAQTYQLGYATEIIEPNMNDVFLRLTDGTIDTGGDLVK